MTQEQKELLLKDLCARLPYGVVVHADDVDIKLDRNHRGLGVLYYEHYSEEAKKNCGYNEEDFSIIISGCFYGHDIKPYLYPLSNMTEEQIYEINEILGGDFEIDKYGITDLIRNKRTSLSYLELNALFEYFNKNHFDYRGLIPMGLAIDATGKNIY